MDEIKTRDAQQDSQIYPSFEDENQDRWAFLTSVPAHGDLRTYYTSRDTQWTDPFRTQESAGHQFNAGMSAYGFINMQPSTESRVGTIYRADSLPTLPTTYVYVPEVNSKIDNQTLIRYFYRFDKNYLPEEIIEIFFLFLLKIKDRAFSIAIKSDRKVIASKQFKVFPFVPHPLFLYITLSISSSTDSSLRITIIPPSLYFIRYQSRRGAKRPRV